MAYNLENGKEILLKTIKENLRHRDYDRVCNIADEYTKFITGVNIESLLKQFVPRENTEAFNQRVKLSQLTTPDIANSLMTPMYKIGRTHANFDLDWKNIKDSETKKNELLNIISNFYGDQSVNSYLTSRLVEIDSTDPNSFIVVEYKEEVNPADKSTKAKPYPFEVNSIEAINYKYINNELQFLIVELEINGLLKYTQYLENESITACQILTADLESYLIYNPDAEVYYTDETKKDKCNIFILEVFEHKSGRIPARRVGTRKDTSTRNRTCVPMIHPAYAYFQKAIKTVSEFDLTNCLHVFQKIITYSEVCPGNPSKKITCNYGKQPDNSTCTECNGTGWTEHKSSADVIRVRLPKDPKDLVSLDNYLTYKGPQMDLLEFQKKLGLYEFKELAIKAVYCSDTFVSNSVVATATEASIDLESIYDTLKFFADSWSAMFKHITYCIAGIRDLNKDLNIIHQFPNDFKMETMSMLLDYLAKANVSQAPSYIRNQFNRKIADKLYVDEPFKLLEIDVKGRYYPFNGKTTDEINNIILNDLASKYNQILYANFENIFSQLVEENTTDLVNFYMLEKNKQSELVKAKVEAMLLEISGETAMDRQASFN